MTDDKTTAVETTDSKIQLSNFKRKLMLFLLLWIIMTAVLMGFISYFDNTNLVTTNGLWKSIHMREWVDLKPKSFEAANLIYFPVNAMIIRVMPESLFGPVWKRMAYVNSLWGGMTLALIYALMRILRYNKTIAGGAMVFQLGCAFFLALATTSEDIMPGIAFLMATTVAMVYFAQQPSHMRIALATIFFTISWFFEWRLILPTALPLVIALYAVTKNKKRFIALLSTALGITFLLVVIAAILAKTISTSSSTTSEFITSILWPGKGLGTGWGGFRFNKFEFLLIGMTQYLFGGRNLSNTEWLYLESNLLRTLAIFGLLLFLGLIFVREVLRRKSSPEFRVVGIVMGGTFVLAQIFNLDVQPQDPQFQINAMIWLSVAWGLLLAVGIPLIQRWRIVNGLVLVIGTLIWLPLNIMSYEPFRHLDSDQIGRVNKIVSTVNLDSTVLISNGFEGINTWLAVTIDWEFPPKLIQAPQKTPKFKPFFLLREATVYPQHTPEESASIIHDYIDSAMVKGFQVVINTVWDYSLQQFNDSWSSVSGTEKPTAVFRMLKDNYRAEFRFDVYGLGRFYQLFPK